MAGLVHETDCGILAVPQILHAKNPRSWRHCPSNGCLAPTRKEMHFEAARIYTHSQRYIHQYHGKKVNPQKQIRGGVLLLPSSLTKFTQSDTIHQYGG